METVGTTHKFIYCEYLFISIYLISLIFPTEPEWQRGRPSFFSGSNNFSFKPAQIDLDGLGPESFGAFHLCFLKICMDRLSPVLVARHEKKISVLMLRWSLNSNILGC